MTAITMTVRFRTARRRAAPAPSAPAAKPISGIARRIALAHHIEALIERSQLRDYADAARRLGLSRARLTQICDLALLAPDIQAVVLLGKVEPRDRHLRAVGRQALWQDQRRAFHVLFPNLQLETTDDDRSRPDFPAHHDRELER